MLVLLFILLASVNSFLLDNPQGNGNSATTNQYLTLSKFYEEMKLQQQDTTKLRHDTDNSLILLTSQLQQKFDLLDKKLAEIERQNETIPDNANLDQKYKQLEQKYLNLEHNFNALKIENNMLQNDRNWMENEISTLRNETNNELVLLKNKSLLVDKNIKNLTQLGNIKQLQDLRTLQQEVQSISAQTSSLNMKEQARSQDFLALYSKVQEQRVTSNRSIADLGTRIKTLQLNHNSSIQNIGAQVTILQTNYNTSITDLGIKQKSFQMNQRTILAEIESKMHDASIRDNQTFIHLQRQIDNSLELVAMTSYTSSYTTTSGIIKFADVKFSVGINNLSQYKNSGRFNCEKGGMYLISASIYSDTPDAQFSIVLNDDVISKTLINAGNSPSLSHTATAIVSRQLHLNDNVSVRYPGSYNIGSGPWSTFTIIKLK